MPKIILAIDPGASGGFAWGFDGPGGGETFTASMPDAPEDVVWKIKEIWPHVCYVEAVSGYIGTAHPGSRMFTFGEGVGVILGALHAFKIRTVRVAPRVWQKTVGAGSGGADRAEWKRHLKTIAGERFPDLTVTLKTADALLMLEHARKAEK